MRLKHAFTVLAIVVAIAINVFLLCPQIADQLVAGIPGTHRDNRQSHHVAEVDLYKKRAPHPLRKDYPELFATEAVVIVFGADWCGWCKAQARELKVPSMRYNILYQQIEDKDGNPNKWSKLMDKLELGDGVPVTVVIEKGEVKKAFLKFTPWAEIKPHAEKAKKNETDDETNRINIGPIHIDWDDGVDIDFNRHRNNRRRG